MRHHVAAAALALAPMPHGRHALTPPPHHRPAAGPQCAVDKLPTDLRAFALTQEGPHDAAILSAALTHGLDAWVLKALLGVESREVATATNHRSGATGIAQFTAGGRWAVSRLQGRAFTRQDALRPASAIDGAARLLRHHLDECGTLRGALGAYGRGRCGGLRHYVARIIQQANRLRLEAGLPPIREPQTPRTRRES